MALSSPFEFTNSFSNSKWELPTLFEAAASKLNIRPYTPRHNGKVERSHREDQKRFYSSHTFFSLDDFAIQLTAHNRRSNNSPMKPLHRLSPCSLSNIFDNPTFSEAPMVSERHSLFHKTSGPTIWLARMLSV